MKRDPDLIRDLMLALEAAQGAELLKLPTLSSRAPHKVDHHFRLLVEAGLATAGYTSPDGRRWIAVRLTWAGHDYLDKIRDPAIGRHTKLAMNKAGAWSLDTMGALQRPRSLRSWKRSGLELHHDHDRRSS